jgi:hypothetical protein
MPTSARAELNRSQVKQPASENPRVNKNEDRGDTDASDADGDLGQLQPEECKLVRTSATAKCRICASLRLRLSPGGYRGT